MANQQQDRIRAARGGLAVKAPCVAVTSGPITLLGEQTVNGVAVVSGDRVLVKDQVAKSENGIYVVAQSNWPRAIDMNGADDATDGTVVAVIATTGPDSEPLPVSRPYYPRTTQEVTAEVTPTDYGYEPGDVRRYGAVTGEVATTTASVNTLAIKAALDSNNLVWFEPNKTYMTAPLFPLSNTIIELNGATIMLVANSFDSDCVFRISTTTYNAIAIPSKSLLENIVIRNGIIDGNRNNQLGHWQAPQLTTANDCPRRGVAEDGVTPRNSEGDHGMNGVAIYGNCKRIRLLALEIRNCFTDGCMTFNRKDLDGVSRVAPDDVQFIDCDMHHNSRQGFSHVGGDNIKAVRSKFRNTNATATLNGTPTIGSNTVTLLAGSLDLPMFQAKRQISMLLPTGHPITDRKFKTYITSVDATGLILTIDDPIPASGVVGDVEISVTHFDKGPHAGVDVEPYFNIKNLWFTECEFTDNGARGLTIVLAGVPNYAGNSSTLDGLYIDNCYMARNQQFAAYDFCAFTLSGFGSATIKNARISNTQIFGNTQILPAAKRTIEVDAIFTGCQFSMDSPEITHGTAITGRSWQPKTRLKFIGCDMISPFEHSSSGILNFAENYAGLNGEDRPVVDITDCNILSTWGVAGGGTGIYFADGSSAIDVKLKGTRIETLGTCADFRNGAKSVIQVSGGCEFIGQDGLKLYSSDVPTRDIAYDIVQTYSSGVTTLELDRAYVFEVGKLVGFMQDNAVIHWSVITSKGVYPDDMEVTILDATTHAITTGNSVIWIDTVATQLNATHATSATVLTVLDSSNFRDGDRVVIVLDDNTQQATNIVTVDSATQITITAGGLTSAASAKRPFMAAHMPSMFVSDSIIRASGPAPNGYGVLGWGAGGKKDLTVSGSVRFLECISDNEGLTGLSQLSGASTNPQTSGIDAGMGSTFQSTTDGSFWKNNNGLYNWTQLT